MCSPDVRLDSFFFLSVATRAAGGTRLVVGLKIFNRLILADKSTNTAKTQTGASSPIPTLARSRAGVDAFSAARSAAVAVGRDSTESSASAAAAAAGAAAAAVAAATTTMTTAPAETGLPGGEGLEPPAGLGTDGEPAKV